MRYRAFFSYARADDKVANWLHRQLDGYRTSKVLVGAEGKLGLVPPKLHPIFRDRTDLEAGGHLDGALQAALEDSETLIVLCTPASAQSRWVNHECETFLKLGRADRIFPVIAGGEPESRNPATECFPPALQGKGILAADLRQVVGPNGRLIGDGRQMGRLKLIAGLLGLSLDAIVQRERRREQQLTAVLGAAAVVFATLGAVAVVQSLEAHQNQRRAEIALTRMYAERAWDAIAEENFPLAVRYALAGHRMEPANVLEYQAAVSRVLHEQGSQTFAARGDIVGAAHLSGGTGLFASGDSSGYAVIRNTRDGKVVVAAPVSSGNVNAVSFSPDGSRFVTGGADGSLTMWESATGAMVRRFLRGSEPQFRYGVFDAGPIFDVSFSKDGTWVLSSGHGGAQIWNVNDSDVRFILPSSPGNGFYAASFAGDDVVLAESGKVQFWNWRAQERFASLEADAGVTNALSISPDGRYLASGGSDKVVKIWDLRSRRLLRALSGASDSIRCVGWSPDGKTLVGGGSDGALRFWDAADGRSLASFRTSSAVFRCMFDSQGRQVLTSGSDRTVRLWDVRAVRPLLAIDRRDTSTNNAAFSPDGKRLALSGIDGAARVFSLEDGAVLAEVRHPASVNTVKFSPDGMSIVTAGEDMTAMVWDVRTGRIRKQLQIHPHWVTSARFSPDGRAILTTTQGGAARIWDAQTGALVRARGPRNNDGIGSAAFSPDGARVVLGGFKTLDVWDWRTGDVIPMSSTLDGSVTNVEYAPSGDLLATTGRSTILWRVRDGRQIATLVSRSGDPNAISFAPNGRILAVGTTSGHVEIWDIGLKRLLHVMDRPGDWITGVAFSPDGRLLAVTGRERDTEVWDVSAFTLGIDELVREACIHYLPPIAEWRQFSPNEIGGDPLISELWLRGGLEQRDVCEGIEDAPAVLR